jgi:putative ABC transport system permease protein
MLIALYLKDENSFDMFHPKGERIYRVVVDDIQPDGSNRQGGNTGMKHASAFAASIPEIEAFVRVQSERLPVKVGNEVFEQEGLYADSNFFSVFNFPLKQGNPSTALSGMYSVVLSGSPNCLEKDVLNKTIELPLE